MTLAEPTAEPPRAAGPVPAGPPAAGRLLDAAAAGSLGGAGPLEVRLAERRSEIQAAQRLRYEVFFEEGSAVPDREARLARRDADGFDAVCDHLVVLDHAVASCPFRRGAPAVVGTYRLLRRSVAERHAGFSCTAEFDVAPLLAAQPGAEFLELGRACVRASHRSRRTVELLWQGIWAYVLRHRIAALIGCASLPGTDPHRLALPLAFLHHHARSPDPWRVRARPDRYVRTDLLPPELVDPRTAWKALPPLLKGYLRVGATFGDGAVVDDGFGTTDVFAVMPVAAVSARYVGHFGPAANRYAA